ncbi:MAG: amidohydrolase [Christensenellaceae bacterium]|jgi:5-methylthioadenosine/S-adenosylhomocysteine deaminase|nr:amidohydrolase [Christensenellaceae bacterium]
MIRLFKNATIVTVDAKRRVLFGEDLLIEGDHIVAVGGISPQQAASATEVIDCGGRVLFPGFINTHTHLFQNLLKGLGDDMALTDWLCTMTFPAASYLQPEDTYVAAMLGCMEGLRSGITTTVDYMYPHPVEGLSDGIAQAYAKLRVRGILGRGCMDAGEELGVCPEIMQTPAQVERDLVRLFDRYHNTENGRIRIWAAPAALWSTTGALLTRLWEIVNHYHAGFTVHVCETVSDREFTEKQHGCASTDCLQKLGILGPNVLMVHCVYLNELDIARSAEYDLKVSHNAVSNMYLSSGVAPIPAMLRAGVTVGLGVDGAASNNGQDMLELMKTTALLQKVHTCNPTVISAEKVLEMATIDGARALGMQDEIGSLEPGKKADIVLFDPQASPKAIPLHNPVSTLVYSSTMQNIQSVLVDGEFVLRDGAICAVADERAFLQRAQQTADALAARAGISNRGAGHVWQA